MHPAELWLKAEVIELNESRCVSGERHRAKKSDVHGFPQYDSKTLLNLDFKTELLLQGGPKRMSKTEH
ncbi:hypothetical protein RB195_013201 [Necator americanus]|uniref:Uncharacterized protein n=1 Tax=Necator americanus TaxID=51031 RepID=A0ABR1DUD3_NECAM